MHLLARVGVVHNRAHRDLEHNVFTLAAGFVGAFAVPPAFGLVFRIETKVHQRIVALARFHDDVATFSTIAAGGPATRNKLLPAEGNAAIAAIAGLYADCGLINKHPVPEGAPPLSLV